MKKEEIHLGDWQRILVGNAPWEFLLEVAIRTLLIYVVLLVGLRLLGKRMNAQLTITELAIMITLGGIVSVAMSLPDRGLLLSVVGLLCALFFQRGLNWLAFQSCKVETLVYDDIGLMVKNGILQLDQMAKYMISKEQVFAALRSQKIYHLGEVKRAYLEPMGLFSVFKYDHPQPGLSILPMIWICTTLKNKIKPTPPACIAAILPLKLI